MSLGGSRTRAASNHGRDGRAGPAGPRRRPSSPSIRRTWRSSARDDLGLAAEPARPDARLLLEQVRPEGLAPAQPPRAGDLDALGRPPVGLHLRHVIPLPWWPWVRLAVPPPRVGALRPPPCRSRRPEASGRWRAGRSARALGTGPPRPPVAASPGRRRLPGPLVGRQHHHHVATVEPRLGLDLRRPVHLLGHPVEDPLAELGMEDLSAPEHDRDLDLVALVRNLATWRVLVSKSPGPIFGRYFISLIPTWSSCASIPWPAAPRRT